MTNPGSLKITTHGDREIVMTRVFDAPRALVFDAFSKPELIMQRDFDAPRRLVIKAMTTPELIVRWLGGVRATVVSAEVDFRVGGRYRYVWRHTNGNEMGMGGVHREIVVPERIVSTEKFDQPWYPGEAVGTIVLVENAGQTTLTQTILYESREARDGVIKSPMEQGVAAGYDRLANLLAKQAA